MARSPRRRTPPRVVAAPRRRRRLLPLLFTVLVVAVAAVLGRTMWNAYMGAPWTRDGTVRVYVVTMAPQVAGQIVKLPIADNQFVKKGQLLMVIDPTNYKIAVSLAEAALQRAQVDMQNAEREAKRRAELTTLSTTVEEQQTYETTALAAQATYQQATANLNQARVNLQRTEIRSPVNGYVTNLLAQLGDYATVGQKSDLAGRRRFLLGRRLFRGDQPRPHPRRRPGDDQADGLRRPLRGHVGSIARAINVANAQPNGEGLASVNPIFTWVRLAQRIPVRIHIDQVPPGVRLVAGMTATVQIDPRPASAAR